MEEKKINNSDVNDINIRYIVFYHYLCIVFYNVRKLASIMKKEMNIILEGEKLTLRKMEQPELKSIDAKTLFSFDFYAAEHKDCEFILLEPTKNECNRYTLSQFTNISKAVNNVLGAPVAFLFDNQIYHEENIMPNNRGVNFIYSNEYAFLPFLFEEQPYCVRRIETNSSCL